MAPPRGFAVSTIFLAFFLVLSCRPAGAYSVLTHEELIDLTWYDSIRPLLLKRFPDLTPAQLTEAHAYAYGGCVIQDLGYYPFEKPFFSSLLHYVRTADFIRALFRESKDADDVAFAIGALSHYEGDTIGHSQAVNLAVANRVPPILQPGMAATSTTPRGNTSTFASSSPSTSTDIVKHRMAPEKRPQPHRLCRPHACAHPRFLRQSTASIWPRSSIRSARR